MLSLNQQLGSLNPVLMGHGTKTDKGHTTRRRVPLSVAWGNSCICPERGKLLWRALCFMNKATSIFLGWFTIMGFFGLLSAPFVVPGLGELFIVVTIYFGTIFLISTILAWTNNTSPREEIKKALYLAQH